MDNMRFLKNIISTSDDKKWMRVENWVSADFSYIDGNHTVREASLLLKEINLDYLIVTDEMSKPVGVVTLRELIDDLIENRGESILKGISMLSFPVIGPNKMIHEFIPSPSKGYIVADFHDEIIGLLTESDIYNGLMTFVNYYLNNEKTSDILQVILSKAYEGIVVVDSNATIVEFNEAYSKFTGIPREKALGENVTEVIENTNLHRTVEQGIPERGVIQNIQGQDMVVHRIPIWKNGKVVGAIGMLIFEGVSEVYRIYENLQLRSLVMGENDHENFRGKLATLEEMIGISEQTASLKREARKAAFSEEPILLFGEKGSGRRILAEGMHNLANNNEDTFILMDATDDASSEERDEIFNSLKTRRIMNGNERGTLFINNIEYLKEDHQQILKEYIESSKQIMGTKKDNTLFRIIGSSSESLEELNRNDNFSPLLLDLFSSKSFVPPLRERKEDIPSLLSFYLKKSCFKKQKKEMNLSPAAVRKMMKYEWPGNVDELVRIIEYLVENVEREVILHTDLPSHIQEDRNVENIQVQSPNEVQAQKDLQEKQIILSLLEKTNGNKSKTAELMGVHRTTLYKKLKKHNILT